MNLSFEELRDTPAEAAVEVVERKGIGHPDTATADPPPGTWPSSPSWRGLALQTCRT